MHAILSYERQPVASMSDLVSGLPADAISSPRRSTVPLLDYWRDAEARLASMWDALGITQAIIEELGFEYPTPVLAGRGKASFTDLMVIADVAAVAIEAKYTEPRYETVAEWLGATPSENRKAVLGGWLTAINRAVRGEVLIDHVRDLPYQMIHRTASVCCIDRPMRIVLYQVFGEHAAPHYEDDLRRLATILKPAANLQFWLQVCPLHRSPQMMDIEERWKAGARDVAESVRPTLLASAAFKHGVIRFARLLDH
jgi:hypothetical protein